MEECWTGMNFLLIALSTAPRLCALPNSGAQDSLGYSLQEFPAQVGNLEWLRPSIEGLEGSRQKCEKTWEEEKLIPEPAFYRTLTSLHFSLAGLETSRKGRIRKTIAALCLRIEESPGHGSPNGGARHGSTVFIVSQTSLPTPNPPPHNREALG